MDIQMKMEDFVVDTDHKYILKNCKEGDKWTTIQTEYTEIKSIKPSGLTISFVDYSNEIVSVRLPNGDTIVISAKECPVADDTLESRTALYEETCIKKWNPSLSIGHFYMVFDDINQITYLIFLRRLENSFLEWEEFHALKNSDSFYSTSRIERKTIDQLNDYKFIPLYGVGLNLNQEV